MSDFVFHTSFITEKKLLTLFSRLNYVQKAAYVKLKGRSCNILIEVI